MKKTITAMLLATAVLLTFSCKKETGPAGPAGPQGAAGNANVKSYSKTVHPADWIYSSTYQEWHYNYYITEDFQSAVLGYIMSGNGKQVMPYVNTPGNCRYTFADNLFSTPPYVQFQFTNFTSAAVAPTSDQFMYLVVIPPGMKKPWIDHSNYLQVKAAYGI